MALEGSDIALAKAPLPTLFERWENIPPRELIDRIRTEVEQEGDFARVQQYVVPIGHRHPVELLFERSWRTLDQQRRYSVKSRATLPSGPTRSINNTSGTSIG